MKKHMGYVYLRCDTKATSKIISYLSYQVRTIVQQLCYGKYSKRKSTFMW